jgi:antitoxin VapB
MALSIENQETERLATEIAELTGVTEEEVVLRSLRERRERLGSTRPKGPKGPKPRTLEEALHHMETEVWSLLPDRRPGRPPTTKAERAELLGYGPDDD